MLATLDHSFRVAFLLEEKNVQQTAENLEIDLGYLMHLIQTKQVKTVEVDGELLLNSAQFDFFLKQRERLLEEYQKYLDEPIPEDIDIKDED